MFVQAHHFPIFKFNSLSNSEMFCFGLCAEIILRLFQDIMNKTYFCKIKAGRTQTNNAQLYLAEHYFEWLSQEKLLCAGDC